MNKKRRNELPYREGDWIAVSLPDGGFALGLIARASGEAKVLFGYFFGPRLSTTPTMENTARRSASDAILTAKFGDYSLFQKEWVLIGHHSHWNRADWPMPPFARVDEKGKALRIEYSDDDPSVCTSEMPCTIQEAKKYPTDGMLGSHVLARRLSKLLSR